jgi:hypothetical protein
MSVYKEGKLRLCLSSMSTHLSVFPPLILGSVAMMTWGDSCCSPSVNTFQKNGLYASVRNICASQSQVMHQSFLPYIPFTDDHSYSPILRSI